MTAPGTRRDFLRASARVVAAAGLAPAAFTRRASAKNGTLRIATWAHFVPAYDEWFDQTFTKAWGERNGVKVVVDHVSVGELRARATGEIAARQGHDLFGFLAPPPALEAHVLPLNDVVTECERVYGKLPGFIHQGTYNPKTQSYFALADSWAPAPLHYRTDWWDEVGFRPDTWAEVRDGARKIREKNGATAGFGLAPEQDSNMALRGLLWSFGAAEQDEAGRVAINSKATVEALRLMATIYKESMTSDVFLWDPSSNNRMFVWGRGSIIQNPISAIRTAERNNPEIAAVTGLAPPAAGPRARLGPAHVVHCYVLWKFGANHDLAKRFLVDLVGASRDAFQASEFYNLPAFPRAAANLRARLAADKQNPRAYVTLADAERWSVCPGYPGYATAAIDEVLHASVIPHMFARVARGAESPEDSARRAEAEMKKIFQKWAR